MKNYFASVFLLLGLLSLAGCQYFEELEWKGLKKNGCLLVQKDGLVIEYARNGQLTKAGGLTFEYSKGRLSKIKVDAQNAYFDVMLDSRDNIIATTLYQLDGGAYQQRGNSTSTYDALNRLVKYESRSIFGDAYWRFEYNAAGNVAKVFSRRSPIHPEQLYLEPQTYDTKRSPWYAHRLLRWLAATGLLQGNQNSFAYGVNNVTFHNFYSVIDPNPKATPVTHSYVYNAKGYPTQETWNTGEVYTYAYQCQK